MMIRKRAFLLTTSILGVFGLVPVSYAGAANPGNAIDLRFRQAPLSFEANRGQTDPRVKFLSRGQGYALFLTANGAVMKLSDQRGPDSSRQAVLAIDLIGSNPNPSFEARDSLPARSNYLVGNRPERWRTNVPSYARVRVREVWPGIDLVYYGNQRRLEYDFVVRPGADPKKIRMKFSGIERMSLDENGELVLETTAGQVRQHKPVVYQEYDGVRQPIEGSYVLLSGNQATFELGAYDNKRTLTIDPVLVYSTFLGGSAVDTAYAVAVNGSGNAYVAGFTLSSDFPVQTAYDATYNSTTDVFVAKLNASGNGLAYSTYIGGSGPEFALAIALDASENILVSGYTISSDFPRQNATQNSPGGFEDAFALKLNAAGTALVWSTYLGGSSHDFSQSIAVDSSGNAYVAGYTASPNFPVLSALQAGNAGDNDGFVTKLDPAGTRIYSTYLGGAAADFVRSIAVDGSGAAYVTGWTFSTGFPIVGGLQSTLSGPSDVFITKINPGGASIGYSTLLGGTMSEQAWGIAVDTTGSAYVAGDTNSINLPVKPAGAAQPVFGGGTWDGFVAKINAAGNATLFLSYLGGSHFDSARALAIDSGGNAYITGETQSANFPSVSPLQAPPSGLSTATPHHVAFVTKLNSTGTSFSFSTTLGGNDAQAGYGIAVDGSGTAYVTGYANAGFPTTAGAYQTVAKSSDAFVTKIASASGPLHFVPITPCRVVDTRWGPGPFGGPIMAGGSTRNFEIPSGPCTGIPANARAYSLNVSVIPQTILSFLSIWPTGQERPFVSTLNSFDGRVKANAAIVPAGTNGAVSVFVTEASHVFMDLNGYFVPGESVADSLAFYAVTPCRVLDTRLSAGPFGGPAIAGGQQRDIAVQSSPCSIPPAARAYSMNFTLVPRGRFDFLTTWPTGLPRPEVSTLNAFTGAVTANAALVPAGTGGAISVFATQTADVVIDINGYFAAPGAGALSFYATVPCRVADTRWTGVPDFGSPSLTGNRAYAMPAGKCGLPSAAAYSLNATVLPQGPLGYLTLWPTHVQMPVVSTLNSLDGTVVSNAAIVPATSGSISAYATDTSELILDINGYFAP